MLTNPLQLILGQASKLPPPTGEMTKYEQRINPNPICPTILLLDISGSMEEETENGDRKINVLRRAVSRPLLPNEMAFVFSSECLRISHLEFIPEPSGSTALHLALEHIAYRKPKHTLIVSDGHPDSPKEALANAERVSGTISTLYIGKDNDKEAIAFMSKLARLGCGSAQVCDITNYQNQMQLKSAIAGLLPNG